MMIGKPCAICTVAMDQPCYDHNPKSGKFRGWLCHQCNVGLGKFKEDYDIVITAANYLLQGS